MIFQLFSVGVKCKLEVIVVILQFLQLVEHKPENIFVTKLDPEKIITDGEDKTATNMNDQTLWTRLWLIEENEDSVAAVVFDLETFSMESYTKVE